MAPERSFTKLGTRFTDLEQASQDRLGDADVLFQAGRFASAIAMGIYSLEIALKAKICKNLDIDALPTAFEIHDLDGLLVVSGLKKRVETLHAAAGVVGAGSVIVPGSSASAVKANWDFVLQYKSQNINELRYRPSSLVT